MNCFKNLKCNWFWSVLLIVMLTIVSVHATTVTLQQGANGYTGCSDTTLVSGATVENYNYGALVYDEIHRPYTSPGYSTIIKFDLTDLAGLGNVTVNSAHLEMFFYSSATARNVTVSAYQNLRSGLNFGNKTGALSSTGEVTYKYSAYNTLQWGTNNDVSGPVNGQDYSSTAAASVNILSTQMVQKTKIAFSDMTATVQQWVNSSANNNGIFIFSGDAVSMIIFYSANATTANAAYRPALVIDYTVPEPATIGLFAIGSLFFIRKKLKK